MDVDLFLYILFRVTPAIVHSFGIYSLLAAQYYRGRNKVQFILLFWLSLVEISLNVSKIIIKITLPDYPKFTFVLQVIRSGFLVTQFCTTMVTMTIDRLVFIRRNIKYNTFNALKLVKTLLFGSFVLSLGVTLTFAFMYKTKTEAHATTSLYLWPTVNVIILTVFVVSYTMIKLTIRSRCKIFNRSESRVYRGKVRREMKVPLLIVSSFILLLMSVDLLHIIQKSIGFELPSAVSMMLTVQICTAYSLDAVFYVFFCQPIRKMWKRKLRSISCCSKEKRYREAGHTMRSTIKGTIQHSPSVKSSEIRG